MSETWLQRFDEKLEQLEQRAGSDESFDTLIQAAESALQTLAKVSGTALWLVRPDVAERLSGSVADNTHSQQLVRDTGLTDHAFVEDTPGGPQLLVRRPVADQLSCALQIEFHETHAPRQSFAEGSLAVLEILTGFVSRHLLSQYEDRLQSQVTMVELVSRLHQSTTLREAASVVVQDGAAALGNCRLSIISRRDNKNQVLAVTGVKAPNADSETVRAILQIAESAANDDSFTSDWKQLTATTEDASEPCVSTLMQNGVKVLRLVPLTDKLVRPPRDTVSHLLIELFDCEPRPDEAAVQQLVRIASPVVSELHQRERTLMGRLVASRRLRNLLWVTLAGLVLIFLPARFEIEVPGQITSTDRRRIFAPESGTVDRVLFENEATVTNGQPLLEMSNPDLDLTRQRIQGSIDTTAAELASVQAQRLTGANPTLGGEEKQLLQQLKNLEDQLRLINRQIQTLNITAPFAGQAFRRDARRELISRPVQQGQLLLEIVPNNSQWQLDLKIPDRLRAYVVKYRDSSEERPQIRYLVVSSPERDWTTTLTSVDNAIQIEEGKMVCRATASLVDLPEIDLRPGTSVMARIHCGHRSLGFVMFREVVEFWHQLKFAWF